MELQVMKKITEVIKNNNVTQVGACYTLYVFIYLASSLSCLARPTNFLSFSPSSSVSLSRTFF